MEPKEIQVKPKSLLQAKELGWFLQQHWPCPPAPSPPSVPWALLHRGLEVKEIKCAIFLSLESNLISEHLPRKIDPGPMVESLW